ncbi:MAG: DUF190 domain-containing protein [Anaerolineae bacterium]
MNSVGSATKVTIYVSDHDRYHNQPLYAAILQRLKTEGAAGATVTRGLAGFGAHSRIHTANIVSLSDALPLIIEWVDRPERVERLLPQISSMVTEGLITAQTVDVIRYSHRALKQFPARTLVREVMNHEVASIVAAASVEQVVNLLVDKGYRVLPVVDDHWHVLGVISEGDLLRAGLSFVDLGDEAPPRGNSRRATDLMTAPPITVRANVSVAQAIQLMVEHGVKRVPVLDDNDTLAGLLSRVDILRLMSEADVNRNEPSKLPAGQTRVEQIMLANVAQVRQNAHLPEIVDLLLGIQSRRVVVIDQARRVQGIITDGDLMARVAASQRKTIFEVLFGRQKRLSLDSNLTAAAVMTQPAVTVLRQTSLLDALKLLIKHQIKRLPVVDDSGRLVGLVGRGGILRALHSQLNRPAA